MTASASKPPRQSQPNPQRRKPELDERLTHKPSSSRVSSQWKSWVSSRRKLTPGGAVVDDALQEHVEGAQLEHGRAGLNGRHGLFAGRGDVVGLAGVEVRHVF